jgi:hypothetical protein
MRTRSLCNKANLIGVLFAKNKAGRREIRAEESGSIHGRVGIPIIKNKIKKVIF